MWRNRSKNLQNDYSIFNKQDDNRNCKNYPHKRTHKVYSKFNEHAISWRSGYSWSRGSAVEKNSKTYPKIVDRNEHRMKPKRCVNVESLEVQAISRLWNNWANDAKIKENQDYEHGWPFMTCTVNLTYELSKCCPRMYTYTSKQNFPKFDRRMEFHMVYKGDIPEIADNIEKFYCQYFKYKCHIPNYVTITKFETEHDNQVDGAQWERSMARYKFDTINFFNFMYLMADEDCGVEIPSDTHWKLVKFNNLKEIINTFFQTIYDATRDTTFDVDILVNISAQESPRGTTGKGKSEFGDSDENSNDECSTCKSQTHVQQTETKEEDSAEIDEMISNLPSLNDIFAKFGFGNEINLVSMGKQYFQSQEDSEDKEDIDDIDDTPNDANIETKQMETTDGNDVDTTRGITPAARSFDLDQFSQHLGVICDVLVESEFVISDHYPWFVRKLTDNNLHNLSHDIIQTYLFCDKLALKLNLLFQTGFSIDHPPIDENCSKNIGTLNQLHSTPSASYDSEKCDCNSTNHADLVTFVGAPSKIFDNKNWEYIKLFGQLSYLVKKTKMQSNVNFCSNGDIDINMIGTEEDEIKKRFAMYIDDQIDLIQFQLNEIIQLIPKSDERMFWWNIITNSDKHLKNVQAILPRTRGRFGYYQNKWFDIDDHHVATLPRLHKTFKDAYEKINLPHLNPLV